MTPAEAFDAYNGYLFKVACGLTDNKQDAEDLVQDAWVRVLRYWDDRKDDQNLRGYFRVIVQHLFIDRYRAAHIVAVSIDSVPDWTEDGHPYSDYMANRITLETIVESRERFEAVKAAIQRLSPVEQRAVAMAAGHQKRWGQGTPAAERIALHRARKHLREAV